MIKTDIVIIGGGLTSLTLNYLLRKENLKTIVVESRDRLGGRIYTYKNDDTAPLEMGATWLQSPHTSLIALLKELNIGIFSQEYVRCGRRCSRCGLVLGVPVVLLGRCKSMREDHGCPHIQPGVSPDEPSLRI